MKTGDKLMSLFKGKKKDEPSKEPATLEMLTEIIHRGRIRNLRSAEIAGDIVKRLKKQ